MSEADELLPPRVWKTIGRARDQGYHVEVKRQRSGPYVVIRRSADDYSYGQTVLYVDITGKRVTPMTFPPNDDSRQISLREVRRRIATKTL